MQQKQRLMVGSKRMARGGLRPFPCRDNALILKVSFTEAMNRFGHIVPSYIEVPPIASNQKRVMMVDFHTRRIRRFILSLPKAEYRCSTLCYSQKMASDENLSIKYNFDKHKV
jgi:hypothetical protein